MEARTSTAIDEQVAAALLPVLLHRVNNTTQLLMAVRGLLDGGGVPARCSSDLADAASAAHEEGWVLGVIAGGLGADVLFARHERGGLEPVLRLVRDGLKRVRRDLEWAQNAVPTLAAPRDCVPPGWKTCWEIARLSWSAGTQLPEGSKLAIGFELSDERCLVRGDGGGDEEWNRVARASAERLSGGARAWSDGKSWTFELPRGAVEAAARLA